MSISTTGMSPTLVADYRYNGLGQRISESDGTDTEYLIYDDAWQLISRFDEVSEKYTEEILYHHAGLGGYGGSSPMDAVILRRTYLITGTPQTEDKRWYILQNWRNDPVVTLTDAGVQVERVHFSPYGEPFGIPSGDTDFDGVASFGEEFLISSWESISLAYKAYADIDLDGDIDSDDATAASGETMGRGVLSWVGSKVGYAGYTQDAYVPTVSHVRYRVYKSDLGRWLQRDPAGYVDGPSLYEYAMSAPVRYVDPLGLAVAGGVGGGGSGGPWAQGCGPKIDWAPFDIFDILPFLRFLCQLSCYQQYLPQIQISEIKFNEALMSLWLNQCSGTSDWPDEVVGRLLYTTANSPYFDQYISNSASSGAGPMGEAVGGASISVLKDSANSTVAFVTGHVVDSVVLYNPVDSSRLMQLRKEALRAGVSRTVSTGLGGAIVVGDAGYSAAKGEYGEAGWKLLNGVSTMAISGAIGGPPGLLVGIGIGFAQPMLEGALSAALISDLQNEASAAAHEEVCEGLNAAKDFYSDQYATLSNELQKCLDSCP